MNVTQLAAAASLIAPQIQLGISTVEMAIQGFRAIAGLFGHAMTGEDATALANHDVVLAAALAAQARAQGTHPDASGVGPAIPDDVS